MLFRSIRELALDAGDDALSRPRCLSAAKRSDGMPSLRVVNSFGGYWDFRKSPVGANAW